ncbi:Baculoviral IAP repeat-containing protein 5 [Blattella germanica]|nr:Baculoviral IAP repeat-containing protein 5 [Blattella germanica]
MEMPLNLELKGYEESRVETFKEWPFGEDYPCNAVKMAEAGFYFCGSAKEPDVAQCFVCFKKLDGWEPEDDPWKEHKKHSPQCPFVKCGKKESDMTYADLLLITHGRSLNALKLYFKDVKSGLKADAEKVRNKLKQKRKK